MPSTRLLLYTNNPFLHDLVHDAVTQVGNGIELLLASNRQQAQQALLDEKYEIFIFESTELLPPTAELIARNQNTGASLVIVNVGDDLDTDYLASNVDIIDSTDLTVPLLVRALRYAQQVQHTRLLKREYHDSYLALITESESGIFIINTEHRVVLANQVLRDLLGYGTSMEGMFTRDFITGVPTAASLFDPTGTKTIEAQLRHQDGHLLPIVLHSRPLPTGDIQLTVRDVAGRRILLEERDEYVRRLRALHEMDEELSQQLNVEYVINMALDSAMRLGNAEAGYIGRTENEGIRLEAVVGSHPGWHPGILLAYTPELKKVMAKNHPLLISQDAQSGENCAKMLLPLIASDRVIGILQLETSKVERFTEEVFNFLKLIASRVAIAIDNADLYRIAQERLAELRNLYEQVSNLEKLKTDMIRIASHDLRNPVSVILTYTGLLRRVLKETLTEQQSQYLQTITDSARRMTEITQNFLSLEQIEANLHNEEPQLVNLTFLVEQIVLQFKSQMETKSQASNLLLPERNVHVRGDSAQLREAIANLMSNAIKYTPANGQITARLQTFNGTVTFTVEDTGYGIAEEEQSKLFQPFQRIPNPSTTSIPGTGLGLYLIKNIIERHHGEVIVKSVLGEGSTFGFSLPTVSTVL